MSELHHVMVCSGCGKAHWMGVQNARIYRLTEKGFRATDPYWFAKKWEGANGKVGVPPLRQRDDVRGGDGGREKNPD